MELDRDFKFLYTQINKLSATGSPDDRAERRTTRSRPANLIRIMPAEGYARINILNPPQAGFCFFRFIVKEHYGPDSCSFRKW
jgi:hypothetical protein